MNANQTTPTHDSTAEESRKPVSLPTAWGALPCGDIETEMRRLRAVELATTVYKETRQKHPRILSREITRYEIFADALRLLTLIQTDLEVVDASGSATDGMLEGIEILRKLENLADETKWRINRSIGDIEDLDLTTPEPEPLPVGVCFDKPEPRHRTARRATQ